MLSAVFDATILVSAFLAPRGLSAALLAQARQGAFTLFLSADILSETRTTLLTEERIGDRYQYTDDAVAYFIAGLRDVVRSVTDLPAIQVSRDPEDDYVIATAIAAGVSHLVTRDKDLLTLKTYQKVQMILPEEFIVLVRKQSNKS